ncbi:VOC family protein [Cryptosporangium sp. NPDC048952]|uniref:VOC family protein n=1 Tax=Cryptosporangium sp. NPDC048952 TaxID=3363961 RepID=UPI003720083B
MITNVAIVNVFVQDQQAGLDFYTDVLGFELRDDVTLDDGFRWCTVGHPRQPELLLSLVEFGPPLPPDLADALREAQRAGGWRGLGFNVDDCARTYRDLVAKGVEFVQEPSRRPYGVEAVCRDNSGNWIVLIETTVPPADGEHS